MKFNMNGRTYEILEMNQEDFQKQMGEIDGQYFGLTIPDKQEIWLLITLSAEQKRKTLYHELVHCYMFNYISFNSIKFDEDDWADISANSHDMIHEIVEMYFQNKKTR